MANIWEHPSSIAQEALTHLEDALVIGPLCAKDKTSEFTTTANGWKKGDTVSFRTHGEYEVKEFSGSIEIQDIQTSSRPMLIEKHLDISVKVTAKEAVLDLDSFSEQVIKPATYKLAEAVDTYLGTKILEGAGLYVSSDTFASAADIAQARKRAILQQLAMNRFCMVDLDTEAKLLGQEWFTQASKRGKDGERTLRTGDMGTVMGMDWRNSIAFPSSTHTAGTMVCATNNGAGGNTNNRIGVKVLTVDTQTASQTVEAGDRLAIAGVRRPVKVATAIADTSATTTVALVDPITEIVPDNAAVTVIGSGLDLAFNSAIFDDRALASAFPMLDLPMDKVAGAAVNNGVSIRIVKGYDMNSKTDTLSLDLLCGAFMLDPRRVTLVAEGS